MHAKPLSAAIVGLGAWGQTLVNAVQGRSDRIRFTAGTTRTLARAAAFAERQGIAMLPDLDAVLARADIQAVVLATPHSEHVRQIEASAVAGKHVFCEKPLTLTGAEAEHAFAACARAGVALCVGHNRRFLPSYAKLTALVATEIGDVLQMTGNFSWGPATYQAGSWRTSDSESPAGGMSGLGIHVIDAMVGLGLDATAVTVANRRRGLQELADTVTAMIEGADGRLAVLTTMFGPGPLWRLEVFGSKGRAIMDGETRLVFARAGEPEQSWQFPHYDIERAELESFAAAADGAAPYPVSPAEAIRGIQLFESVCAAAATTGPPVSAMVRR